MPARAPPAHCSEAWQTSPAVQALWSSQLVPAGGGANSSWQVRSRSQHARAAWKRLQPLHGRTQSSLPLQALPSSHSASARQSQLSARRVQAPVDGLHSSTVQGSPSSGQTTGSFTQPADASQRSTVQGLPSLQSVSFGVPAHCPPGPAQVSPCVHAIPSSHPSPAALPQSQNTTALCAPALSATARARPSELVPPQFGGSVVQLGEHPSPGRRFPSSHCSPASSPLPHAANTITTPLPRSSEPGAPAATSPAVPTGAMEEPRRADLAGAGSASRAISVPKPGLPGSPSNTYTAPPSTTSPSSKGTPTRIRDPTTATAAPKAASTVGFGLPMVLMSDPPVSKTYTTPAPSAPSSANGAPTTRKLVPAAMAAPNPSCTPPPGFVASGFAKVRPRTPVAASKRYTAPVSRPAPPSKGAPTKASKPSGEKATAAP